jgi:ABC-type multidrug transport system ATPase subunit
LSVVVLKNITKRFGSFKALDNINLEILESDAVALLGLNGAGKTTLVKLISGQIKPTNGEVLVFNFKPWKFNAEVRKKIGVMSHNPFLYEELTAYENLRFYGRIYDVENLEERIDELLERMGLEDRKHTLVKSFSRGMKQRLSIARTLIHNPDLLILDEPTSGLDIEGRKELVEYMKGYGKDRTLLLATHDLDEAKQVCRRAAIIHNGKILEYGEIRDDLEKQYLSVVRSYESF